MVCGTGERSPYLENFFAAVDRAVARKARKESSVFSFSKPQTWGRKSRHDRTSHESNASDAVKSSDFYENGGRHVANSRGTACSSANGCGVDGVDGSFAKSAGSNAGGRGSGCCSVLMAAAAQDHAQAQPAHPACPVSTAQLAPDLTSGATCERPPMAFQKKGRPRRARRPILRDGADSEAVDARSESSGVPFKAAESSMSFLRQRLHERRQARYEPRARAPPHSMGEVLAAVAELGTQMRALHARLDARDQEVVVAGGELVAAGLSCLEA
jgi:hypothetical protein